ncbi:MAG TPA: D-alanyl-D-alanine carboxypeptidase family protein [Stellaceae bacterium]|nr:D-alanyl-D-alanine carboxypeptidase family protein [Stellaceae bacterium]
MLAAGAALFFAMGAPAFAHYSSIVIDAATGRVIMAHDPDAQNYPASLTKMMTLFLTFKALEQGQITLGQRFTVSAHAAAQVPSKLGLRPGETITVHDLIYSIVTHSANDSAVVLAENLAGSEPAFALRMTREARRLGMLHTNFANASGLPNTANVTTARDLAILARALYRNFPQDYHYFATEDFSFHGVTYANHNHLMNSYAGMDGIKTGYIHASGFNLAASAVRDGRRLIGVVMGGESAHSRDMQMAALLNAAFARPAGTGTEVADDPNSTRGDDTLTHSARRAIAALSPVGRAEAATPPSHAVHERRVQQRRDGWSIQIGAFSRRATAEHVAWLDLHRIPAHRGRSIRVLAPSPGTKGRLYRGRIVNFTESGAQAACRVLHRSHRNCVVFAPNGTQVATAR